MGFPIHGRNTPNASADDVRTYRRWVGMKERVRPHSGKAKKYYLRGIRLCDAWNEFPAFLADMGECPEGYSLDRIDNEKGYEPGNCRWVPLAHQSANRRLCKPITVGDRTMLAKRWAEEWGVGKQTVRNWSVSGEPMEDCLARYRAKRSAFQVSSSRQAHAQ